MTITLSDQQRAVIQPFLEQYQRSQQLLNTALLGMAAGMGLRGNLKLSDDGAHIIIEETENESHVRTDSTADGARDSRP